MSKELKNIVVIYHANCPDGFAGAWAAWKKFGKKAAYIPLGYGDDIPDGLVGKKIYIIDFSLPRDIVKKLISENKLVTGIDHHKSAEKETKLTQRYLFSLKHSGAVLSWKYFHPGKPIPKLLSHIGKIDLGKYDDKIATAACIIFDITDYDFRKWNKIILDFEKPKPAKKHLENGRLLLAYEKKFIEAVTKEAKVVSFERQRSYAVACPRVSINFVSKVGLALIKKLPPMAIIWRVKGDEIGVSLRSNKSVDVSKIAQKYGGGGHPQSAGFAVETKKGLPWKIVK